MDPSLPIIDTSTRLSGPHVCADSFRQSPTLIAASAMLQFVANNQPLTSHGPDRLAEEVRASRSRHATFRPGVLLTSLFLFILLQTGTALPASNSALTAPVHLQSRAATLSLTGWRPDRLPDAHALAASAIGSGVALAERIWNRRETHAKIAEVYKRPQDRQLHGCSEVLPEAASVSAIEDAIIQNTPGHSEARAAGVPSSYSWYSGTTKGAAAPPPSFTAVTGWGQVYPQTGQPVYSSPTAGVQLANAQTYVHLKSTGEWALVQNQDTNQIEGDHFVANFSGNQSKSMTITKNADGSASFAAPPSGHNDHFWPSARGTYKAGDVDAVYVQMDMRVTDPNLHLVANIGADWWRNVSAPYVNGFGNNPGAGKSNWIELSSSWSTLRFYSVTTAAVRAAPPPPLAASSAAVARRGGKMPPPCVRR